VLIVVRVIRSWKRGPLSDHKYPLLGERSS